MGGLGSGRPKTGKIVKCDWCGKDVYKTITNLRFKHHFCTYLCSNKYKAKEQLVFTCKTCGKKFRLRKSSVYPRSRKAKMYCSVKCVKQNEDYLKNASQRVSGEKNPFWVDGRSREPYGQEFNEKLKERVRARDFHQCQECLAFQKDLGRKLDVHHIDYNKKHNDPSNLISLCKGCNAKANFSREDWIKHFEEKMKKTSSQ